MPQSSVLPTPSGERSPVQAQLVQVVAELPLRSRARSWLAQLAGIFLLIATIHFVEPGALLARIAQLHVSFIVLGAALVVPQLHCLALRWRLTAAQLGFPFAQRRALREYGLSMLLNLLLPFGVAGDAIRVLRHAGGTGSPTREALPTSKPETHDHALPMSTPQPLGLAKAFHSVMLERTMGQLVVIVWAIATLPLWFGIVGVWLSAGALTVLVLLTSLIRRMPHAGNLSARSAPMRALLQLALSLQRLLASPRYVGAQFALSSMITLSIAAQLYCALGALGLSLTAAQATQVFPLMLLSMSLPLAFAGFGPREAVTAELYDILHLSAADGAAFALAFGVILICTSVPCLLLVLSRTDSAAAESAP